MTTQLPIWLVWDLKLSRNQTKFRKTQIREQRIQQPVSINPGQYLSKSGGTLSGTLVVSAPIRFTTASIMAGNGIPEGSITADVGSLWIREDGSGTSTLYIKKTGVGNTGWVDLAAGHNTP